MKRSVLIKKLSAIVLSALLLVTTLPVIVRAADDDMAETPEEEIVEVVGTEQSESDTGDSEEETAVVETEVTVTDDQPAEETASKEEETADPVDGETPELEEDQIADKVTDDQEEENVTGEDSEVSEEEITEASDEIIEETEEEAETEEEETEVEEELNYPEFYDSTTVDGVMIEVYALEGSLPEGTTMEAKAVTSQEIFAAVEAEVESQGLILVDALAFDITLHYEGEEIQPKLPVTVVFSRTDLETADDISVYRVADDASKVDEVTVNSATEEQQEFVAEHFTIYVVTTTSTYEPQGDGSADNGFVLEYGDEVELASRDHNERYLTHIWRIHNGNNLISLNGHTVRNTNSSTNQQTFEIRHWYGLQYESFFITVMPRKYTVTFMLQDVGDSGFDVFEEQEVYIGSDAKAPSLDASTEYDGKTYTLYAWYTDKDCSTEASLTNVRSNLIVYAKYTTNATIHYVKNTTDAATVPADQVEGVGNTVTIASDASRAGYSLAEWNTDPSGEGDSYEPGDQITLEDDLVLYAIWESDYLVMRYYYNYRRSGDPVWRSVSNIPKNSRTRLLSETPTRGGNYVFLGWSTNSFAEEPSYYPDTTYNTGTSNVDLYAVWGLRYIIPYLTIQSLTAKGEEIVYDGQPHTISGVEEAEKEGARIINGYLWVGDVRVFGFDIGDVYAKIDEIKATGTDAGSYSTPLQAELYYPTILGWVSLNEHIPVTNNYLVITPAEVTISTDSALKDYDGDPLTAGGTVTFNDKTTEFTYEGTDVELVEGETINIRTTGSQTVIGESENGYEIDWGDSSSKAKKYNYKFTEELGTLTVADYEYYVYSGDGNVWTKGSNVTSDFVFKCNYDDEGTFGRFVEIDVDGTVVEVSKYEASNGSVQIKLSANYLETLAVGDHKLTAWFDGKKSATAKFTIVEKKDDSKKKSSTRYVIPRTGVQ